MIQPTRAVVFGAASALLTLFTQLTASPHADAQWLPDRSYTEGPGIRIGDLELHPGVVVRGGYDNNVFRVPNTEAYKKDGSAILAVTPHLNLSTLGALRRAQGEDAAGAGGQLPPPVAFNLGASATYFHYFLDEAPKNVEVDFDTSLSVLPERRVGFDVGASYARNTRPFTLNVGGNNNDYAFNRVRPSLTLRGQSHGGVLRGRIGFAPSFTLYESDVFNYLNQGQYEVPAGLSWLFLPSTALLFDAGYTLSDYFDPSRQRTSILLSDAQRFQSRLGVNGAITPNLSARLLVGYAAVVQKDRRLSEREDAVGEAALTYAWSRKDNVEIGYQRQLEIANLGGWNQLDRGYLKTAMLFGGVFALNIEGGVAHVNYGRLLDSGGQPLGASSGNPARPTVDKREDIRLDAGVHLEYRATNWLAVTADYMVLATLTDFDYYRESQVVGRQVPVYPGEFVTHQVFGGIRAHY